ncbi:MAG: TMEM43 family protein, partial [Xanthomonadales bacterium]|nr:TMEM43 family protein [Xanthomonadales bacterium]
MIDWSSVLAARGRLVWVAAGALCLVVALVLLVSVEHKVQTAEAAVGGYIHDLGSPDTLDISALEGELVRISGTPTLPTPTTDPQFGVHADTPVLTRKVEMSQWHEIEYGGGQPSYQRDWLSYNVDSSQFKRQRGHTNPGPMPFQGRRFQAKDVRIAGLKLSPALIYVIPGEAPFPPQLSSMPANLAATFALRDGMLWSNTVAGSPQLGDLRVSWSIVPKHVLTIVARVKNGELVPASHLPGAGFALFVGDVSLDVLMPGVPRPPSKTWLWRSLAVLLAWLGCLLVVV